MSARFAPIHTVRQVFAKKQVVQQIARNAQLVLRAHVEDDVGPLGLPFLVFAGADQLDRPGLEVAQQLAEHQRVEAIVLGTAGTRLVVDDQDRLTAP
jgi:hypothetical protein